jgi:hypothetical protein
MLQDMIKENNVYCYWVVNNLINTCYWVINNLINTWQLMIKDNDEI